MLSIANSHSPVVAAKPEENTIKFVVDDNVAQFICNNSEPLLDLIQKGAKIDVYRVDENLKSSSLKKDKLYIFVDSTDAKAGPALIKEQIDEFHFKILEDDDLKNQLTILGISDLQSMKLDSAIMKDILDKSLPFQQVHESISENFQQRYGHT